MTDQEEESSSSNSEDAHVTDDDIKAHLLGRQAFWLEKELTLCGVTLPSLGVDKPREYLGQGSLCIENIIYMTHLSHSELDLYAIAKKGALFGMELRDWREYPSIHLEYSAGRHILCRNGTLLESGCVDHEMRMRLQQRTLALLVHVCGLTDLVVTESKIINIVTIFVPTTPLDMPLLCQIPFAEKCPGSAVAIEYKDIGTVSVPPELDRLTFLCSPRLIIGLGATCEALLYEAHQQLLLVLANIQRQTRFRASAKKRRFG